MQERILGFVAIALALVIAGLALFWQPDVAERPLPRLPIVEGGDFTLQSASGPVSLKDYRGKLVLVYFGYTFCPDVCPLDSARNAEALDLLDEQGIDAQAVFITVDPKRDTPEVVDEFTNNLHEKMIGLTGTPEEIDAVSKLWKNYYKVNDDGSDYYMVDHATNTYLVMPGHGTVEFFRRDLTPELLAERVSCFAEAS